MAPHAKFVETERDAQVRVEVADLANRKVASLLNAECYLRSRRTSIGNADFMNILIQQLQVPAQDARDVAERLLGAELVCPLGGKYIIPKVRKGSHREQDFWQSTTFKSSTPITKKGIPQLYQDPLLKWFAGLSLELSFDETTLTTHIEVDVRSE
jgi:hypothetical protein